MADEFYAGIMKPETASLIGQFIARWSLAETSLLMPMLVALNSCDQTVAASILSSTNSTEAKIKLVKTAVENMNHHIELKEPIKSALKVLIALCEERNAICHHVWAVHPQKDTSVTIDYRKRVDQAGRNTDRTDDYIRDLCNRTVRAAQRICVSAGSSWLADGNLDTLLYHEN